MANIAVFVAPLKAEDTSAVRQLLVAGLEERWGTYEGRFNPDIESFPSAYDGALVLVAKDSTQVIGTGTLKVLSPYRAEVVRMSVAKTRRRAGVGSLILGHLLRLAREHGAQEVLLETTSTWGSAVRFYAQHGFRKTHEHGENSYFRSVVSGLFEVSRPQSQC